MSKRVVISIHGIRTRGVWQKDLVPILARAGFIPYVLDYGHFTAISLLRRSRRERQVDWLLQEYNRIVQENNNSLPSIIAHSFGTYQVAALIERYPDIKFDKVIFAASIVRSNYDWSKVLNEGRVSFVENDFGGLDVWPKVAAKLIDGAGDSGSGGFTNKDDLLNQRNFPDYKPSNYFHYSHFRANWIPTLILDKRRLVEIIGAALQHASKDLDLLLEKIGAHILVPDHAAENRLYTVPGLHKNVHEEADLGRVISTNLGAMANSGPAAAFNTGQVVVGEYKGTPLAAEQNSPLKFTLSIPIVSNTGVVLGVFNMRLQDVAQDRLKSAGDTLVAFAQAMSPSLEVLKGFG